MPNITAIMSAKLAEIRWLTVRPLIVCLSVERAQIVMGCEFLIHI
ncbi:hypothetical protein [Comamonas odontotermitis]|nr:hypothetical protein [Comamonas odontotermitis]